MMNGDQTFDYATALSKGRKLMQMMRATDSEAGSMLQPARSSAESEFLSEEAFEQWGYERNDDDNFAKCSDLQQVQETLGIDTKDNMAIGHSHLDSGDRNGVYVPVTWAKFNTVINKPAGMIAAIDNESPTQIIRRRRGRGQQCSPRDQEKSIALPELKYWSDVAYLQWISVTKGQEANLQYVVRLGIANAATMDTVRHILQKNILLPDTTCCPFIHPDVTWEAQRDEEAVAALLGTPNGSGVARLLIHHKNQLGRKVVESVQLVHCKSLLPSIRGEPSLVFKIGNVCASGGFGSGFEDSQETVRDGRRDGEFMSGKIVQE